eukprot:CAMPEP_0198110388 /NCGR_PEP_ID=MMETSP1442-20131203/2404_1 /TAXON_ID= /ORGANISM="Craspedostauros australis, Strain CCMP3328" /LENGTH=71 /DNA_ID=CAMNT_0043766413 /DNA_START=360 /DNA_END=573 /DNA_ORIENTATION=-
MTTAVAGLSSSVTLTNDAAQQRAVRQPGSSAIHAQKIMRISRFSQTVLRTIREWIEQHAEQHAVHITKGDG